MPEYGLSRIFPYLDRIGDYRYDSAHIGENTDQSKPYFGMFHVVKEQKLDTN